MNVTRVLLAIVALTAASCLRWEHGSEGIDVKRGSGGDTCFTAGYRVSAAPYATTRFSVSGCVGPYEPDAASVGDASADVFHVEHESGVPCDPCERVALCCATAWGGGCEGVFPDHDVTAARCRLTLAPVCEASCADPEILSCESIRDGTARLCN